ncbi:GatB/YqeY domain-containing protein [Flavobacteriaceae bacterium]|nr:GatB/YqeY domain-containing protein [Flavobacteriaceae bacterium]
MSLEKEVMSKMKEAMKAKDSISLESLRAIKTAITMAKTETGADSISDDQELKILQKLVKQRKDSAQLYKEQGREDLANPELAQAAIIEGFLPAQLSPEELENEVQAIIDQTGASSMKDMGKVMGLASKNLGGSADGKSISTVVKKLLNS